MPSESSLKREVEPWSIHIENQKIHEDHIRIVQFDAELTEPQSEPRTASRKLAWHGGA
jgi:hypothetical protein